MLDAHVAANPDGVAVRYESNAWTWRQWHTRIACLAGGLAEIGVGAGHRIGFLDKNHPSCLELVLAAGSLGAAVTIVNWRQADDEICHVISDSKIRVLFVGSEFRGCTDQLDSISAPMDAIITVGGADDTYEMFIACSEPRPRTAPTDPESIALIIYSSGTTGRPKGVMLSQRALISHTLNVEPAMGFSENDVNLAAMPLFHVGGICHAFMGIHAGAVTTIVRDARPQQLCEIIASGVTHAFLVPPVIAALLNDGPRGVESIGRLRRLVYGAAPAPQRLLVKALATWPDLDLVQVYGQTELSGAITVLSPADHRDDRRPDLLRSVGKAVAGCEIRVVNPESGEQCPCGQAGEILARTSQHLTGYLNQPQATQGTITGDGWVRTGDIGRIDNDGYLFIEDRIKDMIITGGENVYSAEVERVLLEHPQVLEAAVVGLPHNHWGETVKAFVIAQPSITAENIIAFCRSALAGYKCPTVVEFVNALPRNASGKVLKDQLRQHLPAVAATKRI
ncbi:long-chain fatty acid--CoA ligase [Mycobacterium sp. CBMA 623]|nr:long-chain fatty acid--CoA ligase [Mycobacteroides sp. CBMA 326]